ncbi:MAG TPA: hypothetical protein VF795_09680 [Desulfuromonadaceae bacterium]
MDSATFTLKPLPPFRLDLTAWVLRRRPGNLLDLWDGATYRRALALDTTVAVAAVRQGGTDDAPLLHVTLAADHLDAGAVEESVAILERMLGVRVDLCGFYDLGARDERLGVLAGRFRGVKPTRFPTFFEGVANAVSCQQVSLAFGIQLIGRLAETFGPAVSVEGETLHAFPCPADIVGRTPEEFRLLGFSRSKGEALIDAARMLAGGGLDPASLEALGNEGAIRMLSTLRGLGRWSAEYLLLRTCGRMDVFPADDVGGQKNLQRWLQLPEQPGYHEVQRLMARWHPYGGLIYFHLLLDRLEAAGHLS